MARRRQSWSGQQQFSQQEQTQNQQQTLQQQSFQGGVQASTGMGADKRYENAVESTHNGNYAWNGQPIPSYQPYNQGRQNAYGGQGTSSHGTLSQGTSSQGTFSQGASSQGMSSQGTNSQGMFSQGTSSQGMFSQGTSSQGMSSQGTNYQGMHSQGTSSQGMHSQGTNYQGMQSQGANSQGMLSQGSSSQQSYRSGMPAPGASGDQNAPYGQRNTGINNADARNVGFQGGYTGYGANGQPVQYGTFMRDGTQYGKGPHTIDPNKEIITAVRYQDGGISAVKFQDGTTADIAQAIGMAEAGLIEDVNTGRNREGQKTLRSYPDGDASNNLSNLPRF